MSASPDGTVGRRLKAFGLRSTRPRRVLVRVLAELAPCTDPMALFELARRYDPRIARSTVYRFLARLRRNGAVAPSQCAVLHTH
jgi:Fe2+ or Zn2+ uptake regulation protein